MFSGEKLTIQMKKKGFTNKRMADTLTSMGINIGEDSFKSYRQDRANPRIEVLCGIAEVLGIIEQDLFNNPRANQERQRKSTTDFSQTTLENSVVKIPIFLEGNYTNNIYDLISKESIYIEVNHLKKCHNKEYKDVIAILIDGDVPTPDNNFKENDILLIQLIGNREFSKLDGLYLVGYGNIMQIKKVQFLGNNEVKLISLNPEYPPINPRKDLGEDWEIFGKVVIKLNTEYYDCLKS